MPLKTAQRKHPGNAYFAMIRRFPLTSIANHTHLVEAREVIDRLLAENLDQGGQAYLAALADLVEVYENEHERIPGASESDVLRLLMQSNDQSQSSLSKATGISQSTISAVLTGQRAMTKDHMNRLGRFFNVSPAVFFRAE